MHFLSLSWDLFGRNITKDLGPVFLESAERSGWSITDKDRRWPYRPARIPNTLHPSLDAGASLWRLWVIPQLRHNL